MISLLKPKHARQSHWLLLMAFFAASLTAVAATLPVISQWERFEVTLKSKVTYQNAIQQATLDAIFISPSGATYKVPGFWDGGKIWRVRFSPGTPGRWTYHTVCSDTANAGLHNQAGQLLCTAATGKTRFGQHGPVRVARDHAHLEHEDYTPFFWVGDAAWNAGRLASEKDWQFYAHVRASQKFNAVQWTLSPGLDFKGESAFHGKEQISLNLNFFKRLDAKVDTLNREGLLNAIAPLWEIGASAENLLPESQAIVLLRYAVARWGSDDVAWVVAFEGEETGQKVDRWKRIGRAVFGDIAHAPVILLPGETHWLFDEFRNENWVDVLGCQTARVLDEDSLQWLLTGPLTLERRKQPARPVITLMPPTENALTSQPGQRLGADQTRKLLWWSALINTPAGVSYSAQGVAHWDTHVGLRNEHERPDLPVWQKELFLPGARDIEALGDFFSSINFWKLQPFARAIPNQPGLQSPRRYIAAGGTETGDLFVAYVPEDRNVDVAVAALPSSAAVAWVNTRDGKPSAAVPVAGGKTFQFPTPDPGDWVLVMKSRK